MDRSCDMEKFLILLVLGLAAADKLDRIYLPPPGAKFSGGNPEDLQIPLEFPIGPKDATSQIAKIVPDIGTLTSDYNVGSTVEPNIGQIVDITSDSKSPQTYFSNTSPVPSYTYFAATSSKENYSESTKRPLEIKKDVKNFNSQKHNAKLDYFVPNTQVIFPRISQDSMSAYQYSALNPPLFGTKLVKPALLDNIKKYLNLDEGDTALSSQILNAQNQVLSQHSQDNAPIYDHEVIVPSTEDVQNLRTDFTPITKNYQSNGTIQTIQYAPNAKTIDKEFTSHRNPANNKLDSTISTSDIKPNTPETKISVPSIKSRPLAPRINTRIASSEIRQRPERPQAQADRHAVILNYRNVITPNRYSYNYDTSNGISANESGTANNGARVHGAYSYTGDDGKIYRVVYTADENGFLPRGDHIPTVPIAIQRLIEKAVRERKAGISDDGSYDEAKYGHRQYQGAMERYHPEFQGITNKDINRFGDYSRKRFGGKDRPMKSIVESNKLKYNGKNRAIHETNGSIGYEVDNRMVLLSNLRKGTKKQLDNSFTRTVGSFTDDAADSTTVHELSNQQNINNYSNQGDIKSADLIFPIKQEQRSKYQPSNWATISSGYSSKETLHTKQNIPEIIGNSNVNITEKNQANRQNGYFYTTPQKKFIENGNQVKNKDITKFITDQELEIGDDEIITISVPLPNNFARVDNEVPHTALENIFPSQNNDNQGIDNLVHPNNPTYNINLPTMTSDINIQPNESSQLTYPAKYGIYMNPAVDPGDGKYANVQKPEGQIVHENRTPNIAFDEFGRLVTEDLSTVLKFNGETPDISLSDFENNFGTADGGNLEKDEINVSNIDDYRKGIESSKPISNYGPERISEPTAKTIIGEDFTGPKRPQAFDPENGYYY